MSTRTYRLIGNLSFALAIAAVLSFDSFGNHLIPGSVLVAAGLLAGAIHTSARFKPLKRESLESAESQSICETTAENTHSITNEEAKRKSEVHEIAALALFEEAEAVAEAMAIETHQVAPGRHYFLRYVQRSQLYYARQLQQAEQVVGPDWRTVRAAIEVAQALNPQPTEYEVTLTHDGTLKISPKLRSTQTDPQFEERVRPSDNPWESKLVH